MTLHIALVDDDRLFLDLLREVLSEAGYEAHPLQSSTVEQDAARLRDLVPDAIVLDVPAGREGAGWEVRDLLRRDEQRRGVIPTPIILCVPDVAALRADPADDAILAKPFDLDELLALLRHLVGDPS